MEFLSTDGWLNEVDIGKEKNFKFITSLPVWESTIDYSNSLELWYSFNINFFEKDIYLYTSTNVTSNNWEKTKIYTIPEPWGTANDTVCYAAKSHKSFLN